MDPSEYQVTRSPRRELQGPRPAALKVGKDSHKIAKKPPVDPQHQKQQQQQQQQPPRQPVVIYTVSPKVIHTNPSEFMNLVQRLTGSGSDSTSCSTSSPTSANPFNVDGGAVSPAARLATIEKANSPKEKQQQVGDVEGVDMGQVIEKSSLFPGILSPGPASLPPISPNFFSSLPSDPNTVGFFHDFSPGLLGNRNFIEGGLMPSPSTFFSPSIISPNSSVDLFNNLFDF